MRLDTKKVDKLLERIADKIGIYISIKIDRTVHPKYSENDTVKTDFSQSLYIGQKVKLKDGTVIKDDHICYNTSKELYEMLLRIEKEGKLI